jgi:hypothetical protein
MGNAVAVMEPAGPTGHINMARVVLGGIVAGLIINFSEFVLNQIVLLSDMTTALARMNLPPAGGSAIPVFIVLGFVGGIAAVWLYAAIRPRFGAGPRTAFTAGVYFWLVGYFWSGIVMYVLHMYPARLMAVSLSWALIESILATIAGAAIYTETP